MEDKEAKSIIESILFISGEPVTLDSLRKLIEVDKYNTGRLLEELVNEYAVRNSGLLIVEVAEGYQMVTNPACAPWVKKLLSTSVPKKLSQSSLETLAIIAYKQPIIKSEIEAIRGVNSDGVVKTLLERRLVKILGRKEVPGRPLMYGTTREFLQYFGLKDLTELPTLKEFEEVDMPEPPEHVPEESGPESSGEESTEETAPAIPEDGEKEEIPPSGQEETRLDEAVEHTDETAAGETDNAPEEEAAGEGHVPEEEAQEDPDIRDHHPSQS